MSGLEQKEVSNSGIIHGGETSPEMASLKGLEGKVLK